MKVSEHYRNLASFFEQCWTKIDWCDSLLYLVSMGRKSLKAKMISRILEETKYDFFLIAKIL